MHSPWRLSKGAAAFSAAMIATGLAAVGPASANTSKPATASPTPAVQSITTVAGNGTRGSAGDGGPAVSAQLNLPTGVAEDLSGALYIGDTSNNKVRKVVNPTAINIDTISTFAGTGVAGFSGDNGPATVAELNEPTGVAVDGHSGSIYIADTANNRVRVVNSAGTITTFAGNGKCSKTATNGVAATATSLCHPTDVAVGPGGVYISDTGHNEVRLVTPGGTISAFAGNGIAGHSGDGHAAVKAELNAPTGLAVDSLGDVFIADTGNTVVRETKNQNIYAFAGNGTPGFAGDGGPATSAELNFPTGLALDQLGDVFISDTQNQRIRKVAGGSISTYAGNGTRGYSGDGGPATAAELNTPTGEMTMDGSALYFADTGNQRLRGIFTGPPPVLPETPWAIILPIGGVVVGGGTLLAVRRRRQKRLVVA